MGTKILAKATEQASWRLESSLIDQGFGLIAGVDEAGRGAWAGPLAVAAVVLPFDNELRPYFDSKQLSVVKRNVLAKQIKDEAISWIVEFASAKEIDAIGPLKATLAAAERALNKLKPSPNAVISDYLSIKTLHCLSIAKGDQVSYSVAAASILAKAARDQFMKELSEIYPSYGFEKHKGYGTKTHFESLLQSGPCKEHRLSFKPIRNLQNPLFKV